MRRATGPDSLLVIVPGHGSRSLPSVFFTSLLLTPPTASILPIAINRRVAAYSAMRGLLLILGDVIGRARAERKMLRGIACTTVVLLTITTHAQAEGSGGRWTAAAGGLPGATAQATLAALAAASEG